jgi:glycosyltransferase involved in cell wall biosynthesis
VTSLVDVDFSLAIHNRTGKYFIGRDLVETPGLPLGDIYYWRIVRATPPSGLPGKIIGRLQHFQIRAQALGGAMRWLPRRRSRRPLLHLDPFTVPTTELRDSDAVLCHDIGPVTHPELFDPEVGAIYAHIYRECERVGPHMIFVSEATRRAYQSAYPGADQARMRVIYPATRAGIVGPAPVAIPGIDGPFLLTVGSLGDRKNQARCIEAFAQSGLVARGFRYVLCGAREPGAARVEALAKTTPGVICLPYVDDAGLSWLYGNARGFVLASLLEGFGMPVAEAVARDLVPLVSAESVLHEVAGDGALLTDPKSTASIAAGMSKLVEMSEAERVARLDMLRMSVSRFDVESIRDGWRRAFADILKAQS